MGILVLSIILVMGLELRRWILEWVEVPVVPTVVAEEGID